MRKKLIYFILILTPFSCDKAMIGSDPASSDIECFNIFWNNFDLHYPTFIIKNINWDSVRNIETTLIATKGLYYVLNDVGKKLRDGHFQVKTSSGKYIESPFPWNNRPLNSPVNIPNYLDLQVIYQKTIMYGIYDNIGYISVKSFDLDSKYFSQITALINNQFKDLDGIIVDIRDNPGGLETNSDMLAGNFTDKKILAYTFKYRNGPNHSDLGTELKHYINPSGNSQFLKPVAVLTNRRCASASEMFCLSMRMIPGTFMVGDTTSGTISDPQYQELPNGWIYRMPVAYVYTPNNEIFEEKGIPPHYPVWMANRDSIRDRDLIFETAVNLIKNK